MRSIAVRPSSRVTRAAAFAIVTATVVSPAHAQFALRGSVLGNGGNTTSNAQFHLTGTVGQPAVGASAGALNIVCSGFWCFGGSRVVAVDPPGAPVLPKELAFEPPAPNPARQAVSLVVALPGPARVQLVLYDVSGREVRRVADGVFDAGVRTWHWNGDDATGGQTGAGMYFARLVVDGRLVGQRRLVVIR